MWCNGDCTWVFGDCEYTTGLASFKKIINGIIDHLILFSNWYWWHLPWIGLFGLCMFVYAVIYKGKLVDEFPDKIPNRDLDYDDFKDHRDLGLFAVCSAPSQCCWAFLCTPVLAAKNYQVGKSCGYWPSCCVMFLMYTPLFCVAVLMRAIMSSKLLRNMRIRPNWCELFCGGLCCMCCGIGRESIEVDEYCSRRVTCAFNMDNTWVPDWIEDKPEDDRSCSRRMCEPNRKKGLFDSDNDRRMCRCG